VFPYYGVGLLTLLVQFACAAHVLRSERSWLWILPIILLPWVGCAAYLVLAVLPDVVRARRPARRVDDAFASIADSGASYGQKKRDVERIGSAQSKRLFAEECIKRNRYSEAVDLYRSAMQGALADDPALLHGLARAKLHCGDGAGSQTAFEQLRDVSPADFTMDAQLGYARALALQGKHAEASVQFEKLLQVYAGAEALCRYALMLHEMGDDARSQGLFRQIVASRKDAPAYYRRKEREWVNIAKQNLRR
jgi:hypothetical protein